MKNKCGCRYDYDAVGSDIFFTEEEIAIIRHNLEMGIRMIEHWWEADPPNPDNLSPHTDIPHYKQILEKLK